MQSNVTALKNSKCLIKSILLQKQSNIRAFFVRSNICDLTLLWPEVNIKELNFDFFKF